FNQEQGITPTGVKKEIKDLIDGVYSSDADQESQKLSQLGERAAALSEKELAKEIKRLEKAMLEYAKNLEFEKAAQARDQLTLLKERVFGASTRHDTVSGAEPEAE